MRGNYEPPELLWGQHLISSSSWHQVQLTAHCSSLPQPQQSKMFPRVTFYCLLQKARKKGLFMSSIKLFVGSQLPKSEQNFDNHQSVKYDAHLFRIKISQLWGLRSDIAQNVTPSQRNQIRPFHPIPSLSNASWLRYLWVCTPPCAYLFIYSIHKQSKTMPIYADNLWPWAVHVYSQYT